MKCPETVPLSREDGEALRTRLAGDALTADDRRVLDHVLQWYFWLLFALQEATVSLKRLRVMLFGEKPKKRQAPPADPSAASRDSDGGAGGADESARPRQPRVGGASSPPRAWPSGGAGV